MKQCSVVKFFEIPYLVLSKDFAEVRDAGFDKVPGVGWTWD